MGAVIERPDSRLNLWWLGGGLAGRTGVAASRSPPWHWPTWASTAPTSIRAQPFSGETRVGGRDTSPTSAGDPVGILGKPVERDVPVDLAG